MKFNLPIHPLSLTTYFRMAVTMVFLLISGTMVNELGFFIALNGMFISLITSGHGLVLSDTSGLGKLTSYSIFVFFGGILFFFFFLPVHSALGLAIYFIGSIVFAQGSISMKLSSDNRRLFILFVISVFLKALVIFFFYKYKYPIVSLVLFGLTDLIYFRFSLPEKGWFNFGVSVLILSLGGFVNQFTGIQMRNEFIDIQFFEWIMRLIEMPSMLAWTFLLYGWSRSINYYNKESFFYRILFILFICLIHLFIYYYSDVKLNLLLSLSIILYNIFRVETSILGLNYIVSGRTVALFGIEIIYFLIVMSGLEFDFDILSIVYLLVLSSILSLFLLYNFKKHGKV